MGIYYDAGRRDIVINYEPTNYKTDYDTNRPINYVLEYGPKNQVSRRLGGKQRRTELGLEQNAKIYEVRPDGSKKAVYDKTFTVWGIVSEHEERLQKLKSEAQKEANSKNQQVAQNRNLNKQGADFNAQNAAKNAANQAANNKYNQFRNTALSARGGDYVAVRDAIRRVGIGNENVFKDFYRGTKLQTWNTNLGAKPPYGSFNGSWYLNAYGDVKNVWDNAVRNDDIDITERYGGNSNIFALAHYTNNGQYENRRGNPVENTTRANQYAETPPTDAEIQDIRNKQLGVDLDTQTQRLLSVPEIAA